MLHCCYTVVLVVVAVAVGIAVAIAVVDARDKHSS